MIIFILLLCFVGLWVSVYFTGIYYRWFKPDVFWVPQVCRLKEATCMNVLDTPRAKLFGIPNSVFGIFVYSYLMFDQFFLAPIFGLILLGFAVARSIYLAYSLLFMTKIPCPLCFTSHIINVVLFLIVLKMVIFG